MYTKYLLYQEIENKYDLLNDTDLKYLLRSVQLR